MTMAAGRAAARSTSQAMDSGLLKFGVIPGGGGMAPVPESAESIGDRNALSVRSMSGFNVTLAHLH